MKRPSEIIRYGQRGYMENSAIRADSQIIECGENGELAYVITPSSKDRWLNGVSRCEIPPERFSELHQIVKKFEQQGICYNWQLWPGSHPDLESFLQHELKLLWIADARILAKDLSHVQSQQPSPLELKRADTEAFMRARMLGWENTPEQETDVRNACEHLTSEARNITVLKKEKNEIVGSASAFILGEFAYLKGDFVVPSSRGGGLYDRLILAREYALSARGVRTAVGLGNSNTVAPILLKRGYADLGLMRVFARWKTPWVSI